MVASVDAFVQDSLLRWNAGPAFRIPRRLLAADEGENRGAKEKGAHAAPLAEAAPNG